MKSILLASASLFAFAGAASATVEFAGSATLGFNADDTSNDVYWDAELSVTMSQELNNGLTASATFDVTVADESLGEDLMSASYVLSLTSDMGGLYFGDTDTAQDKYWSAAGDMASDAFSANDGGTVLRGEAMFGGVTAAVSYFVDEGAEDFEQLGFAATGSFGSVDFAVAYQEEATCAVCGADFNGDQVFGISVGTSFSGADVTAAYASNETDGTSSVGVEVSYPIGPVTVGAFYVIEDADVGDPDDSFGISADYANGPVSVSVYYEEIMGGAEDWAIEGSYDVGNGLMVYAGIADAGEDMYVAGTYDLGNGASLLVSYADDGDGDAGDEIGDPEYMEGATLELSLEF